MRYIGSKTSTLPFLTDLVQTRAPRAKSLCDPFAGTCTVSRHFKRLGFQVTTGDVLRMSYVFQVATIRLNRRPLFEKVMRAERIQAEDIEASDAVFLHLNNLDGMPGYIYQNYSPGGKAERLYFSCVNASRIDSIRHKIRSWRIAELLDENEESYLLAALINASDKVANTAGTYYAHLKNLSRKACLPLRLAGLETTSTGAGSSCQQIDARELCKQTNADILYLDPPYNERNYKGYYHLPETIANGTEPEPRGRSGVPAMDSPRSDFCRPAHATHALADICKATTAKHIVVHYATDGIIPHDAVVGILEQKGPVRIDELDVRAYSAKTDIGKRAKHRVYWCDIRQAG